MFRALVLAAAVALAGCAAPIESGAPMDGVVVRAGTSFGMCEGYCLTELQVVPDEVLYIESSRNPARYPERTRRAALGAGEWEQIAALAKPSRFEGLRESYGCPDCADGGAEWIEVESDGTRRRVTFEYGADVGPIQPLIAKTRAIRERFAR